MKIRFIGGGNMARAIIGGLKNNGFDTTTISVIELDAVKREQLAQEFNVNVTDNYADIVNTDVVLLAVKPQQLKATNNCPGHVAAADKANLHLLIYPF